MAATLAASFGVLPGCGTWGGGSDASIRSVRTGAQLGGPLGLGAYAPFDNNTADIYLTDLDHAYFEPGSDWTHASGRIVHLHLFVTPQAGQTPIDDTACSVTARCLVVADGELGVYGGGGFLVTSSEPGKERLDGVLRGATLRLIARSDGFEDLLGPSELDASFTAPRDEALARRIGAWFDLLVASAPGRAGRPRQEPAE